MTRIVIYCVFTLVLCIHHAPGQTPDHHSVTACAGTGNEDCDYYRVSCGASHRVRLLAQRYGSKGGTCHVNTRRCGPSSTSRCCVYKSGDCMQKFMEGHRFDVFEGCSGLQTCRYQEAARATMAACGGDNNTYVRIEYQCIPESSILGFCDGKRLTAETVNVIFDGSTKFASPTDCLCAVSARAPTRVHLDVVDARLLRMSMSRDRRRACSSVVVTTSSPAMAGVNIHCTEGAPREGNFLHGRDYMISLGQDELVNVNLNHLYNLDPDDRPMMVWISMTAVDTDGLDVICYSKNSTRVVPPDVMPPTTTGQGPSTPPTTRKPAIYIDSTDNAQTGGSDDNTLVIIGAIVGVAAVVLVLAFIAYVVRRRKHHSVDRQKDGGRSKQQGDSRAYETIERARASVTSGRHYDDIGDVPDVFQPEPVYDQPYVHAPPGTNGLELTAADARRDGIQPTDDAGHVYEAVSGDNQDTNGEDGTIVQQQQQQHGQQLQQTSGRPFSNYDHLHRHAPHTVGDNKHLYSQTRAPEGPGQARSEVAWGEGNTTTTSVCSSRSNTVPNEYVEFDEDGSLVGEPSIKAPRRPASSEAISERPPVASPRVSKVPASQPPGAASRQSAYSYAYTDGTQEGAGPGAGAGADRSLLDGYMEPITCRTKRL